MELYLNCPITYASQESDYRKSTYLPTLIKQIEGNVMRINIGKQNTPSIVSDLQNKVIQLPNKHPIKISFMTSLRKDSNKMEITLVTKLFEL